MSTISDCGSGSNTTGGGSGCDTCKVLSEIKSLLESTLTNLSSSSDGTSYKDKLKGGNIGGEVPIFNLKTKTNDNSQREIDRYAKDFYTKMTKVFGEATGKSISQIKNEMLKGGDAGNFFKIMSNTKLTNRDRDNYIKEFKASGGDMNSLNNIKTKQTFRELAGSVSEGAKEHYEKYLTKGSSMNASNAVSQLAGMSQNMREKAIEKTQKLGLKGDDVRAFTNLISKANPNVQSAILNSDKYNEAITKMVKGTEGLASGFERLGEAINFRSAIGSAGGLAIGAVATEAINYANINMNSPAQSKLEQNKRLGNSWGNIATTLGGAMAGVGGAMMVIPGAGTAIGGAMAASGVAIGTLGKYGADKAQKELLTKDTLNSAYASSLSDAQKREILDNYGNEPDKAIKTIQQMAGFSKDKNLPGFLSTKGRNLGNSNLYGLAGASDGQIGSVLKNLTTLNRSGRLDIGDVAGLGEFAKSNNISSEYVNNLTGLLSKSPSIVSGDRSMLSGVQDLYNAGTTGGAGMLGVAAAYNNLGFSSKVSTDAITEGLLGASMDDILSGKISKDTLRGRIKDSGMPMSLLKEQFPLVYDAVAESGSGKAGESTTDLLSEILKILNKFETEVDKSVNTPKLSMDAGANPIYNTIANFF